MRRFPSTKGYVCQEIQLGSGLLTHRRNHCGSFASGPPRWTRPAVVAEMASPGTPRWRSGQLCAKRLSADSVFRVYPGGEVGVACGGARHCQVRRAWCRTDLAGSPLRHNGLSSQDWWAARVVRRCARSSHHRLSGLSGPSVEARDRDDTSSPLRVLGSALRDRNWVRCRTHSSVSGSAPLKTR